MSFCSCVRFVLTMCSMWFKWELSGVSACCSTRYFFRHFSHFLCVLFHFFSFHSSFRLLFFFYYLSLFFHCPLIVPCSLFICPFFSFSVLDKILDKCYQLHMTYWATEGTPHSYITLFSLSQVSSVNVTFQQLQCCHTHTSHLYYTLVEIENKAFHWAAYTAHKEIQLKWYGYYCVTWL